jgi:hypothetical protein
MKYEVYLSSRANKQYKRFDDHIRNKIRTGLTELQEDPSKKGFLLQGFRHGLRYMKFFHANPISGGVRCGRKQKRSSGHIYRFARKLLQRTQKIYSLRDTPLTFRLSLHALCFLPPTSVFCNAPSEFLTLLFFILSYLQSFSSSNLFTPFPLLPNP